MAQYSFPSKSSSQLLEFNVNSVKAGELVELVDGLVKNNTEHKFSENLAYYTKMAKLDDNKIIIAYRAATGYGMAIIVHFENGHVKKYSDPIVFNAGSTYGIELNKLDSNRAIVTFQDNGNSNYGTAIVLKDVNGVIKKGEKTVFSSVATGGISNTVYDTDKVIVFYGNTTTGKADLLTVSDTTITPLNVPVNLGGDCLLMSSCLVATNKVFVSYAEVSAYGTKGKIVTISGTTITLGTYSQADTTSPTSIIECALINPNAVIITYSTAYDVRFSAFDISGTTLSRRGGTVLAAGTIQYYSVVSPGENKAIVSWINGNVETIQLLTNLELGGSVNTSTLARTYDYTPSFIDSIVMSANKIVTAYSLSTVSLSMTRTTDIINDKLTDGLINPTGYTASDSKKVQGGTKVVYVPF